MTHPHVVPNTLIHLWNTNEENIFLMKF